MSTNKKTIALASDHAGYPLKEALIRHLNTRGIDTIDYGTNNTDSCDYPDF
ncbi:MAG: RpiB/LacA/LacB family sugar-phosphate isomerase, partial [Clostridia bacterium]|nr:RpiB/LacA/LacB family sugar-phosphate isomerase [Clostridia bacterium]